ncbi:cysteine proteinase [Calocera cornea HHB12733]|uniref:Cysteine proteinase n=1 Tax=Calocera cornea HHB12733 TaxID=1353952 RepID=A0A165HG67_9BASI|nr:cysteine proteinase [Calocera cornea HHB12733]
METYRGLTARPIDAGMTSAPRATLEPLRTSTLQIPPAPINPADGYGASSPVRDDHTENDIPSKVDTSESQLSRAGLTLKDVLSPRPSTRRQDTITYRAIQGLETASTPVTLVATEEFLLVQDKCRRLVERISRDCRRNNKRFRDESWDISTDQKICLQGLLDPESPDDVFSPYSVERVQEIFNAPKLFVDGVNADDIRQGASIGDCWFVSALAVVANLPHLLERLCVHYDAQVGVYGFIFFRDGHWITTVIDDQLFIANRQYDELEEWEKNQWHNNRKLYEDTNLRGSRALYFSASSDPNETWVPLYEKAYAKCHGDYECISGGFTGEAIEDLTGGISALFKVKDILDVDKFWEDELLHANKDRLFACYIQLAYPGDLNGLYANHAYSILEAKEVHGRRFLVIRNPWGEKGEWQGPWSDGSDLWTPQWMLDLNHKFGNDGRFIMEYTDFLKVWQTVDRCLLFDETWHISSAHTETKLRPWPAAPSFGDVCFTVKITDCSPAIFVLSQHDSRYFKGLEGYLRWSLEFRVFRAGEKDYLARSEKGWYGKRSVTVEFKNLEPGEYIVHVRLDRFAFRNKDYLDNRDSSDAKLYRVHAKLMESRSLAPNYDRTESKAEWLSPPSAVYDGRPLSKIPKIDIVTGKLLEPEPRPEPEKKNEEEKKVTISESPKTTTFALDEPPAELMDKKGNGKEETGVQSEGAQNGEKTVNGDSRMTKTEGTQTEASGIGMPAEERADIDSVPADKKADPAGADDDDNDNEEEPQNAAEAKDAADDRTTAEEEEKAAKDEDRVNADSVFLLLRVYSKDAAAKIAAETRL